MKKRLLFLVTIILISKSYAQSGNNPGFGKTGAQDICEQLSFSNDDEVNNLVNKILDYAGVENRNYEIRGCGGVSSCYATVKNNQQYIVYQPDYLKGVKSYGFSNASLPSADKDWQALTILAHEVGHLINTHFFNCRQDITPWNKELQADEFAGRIIYQLNGTLEQAKSVYNTSVVSAEGSMSHPPRADRLNAVAKGYRKAESLYPRPSNNRQLENPVHERNVPVQNNDNNTTAGFTMLPSGLAYKFTKRGGSYRKAMLKDHVEMHIKVHVPVSGGDSIIFDSYTSYNNQPVPLEITQPKFKGDPQEGFMLMAAGDNATFILSVEAMKKAGNETKPWMKDGMEIHYEVAMVSVNSDAEFKKDNDQKTSSQSAIDDRLLQDYFSKNNIRPLKTASGLYYTISTEGRGEKIKSGQTLSVNYTGKFLNGKAFDSNTDPSFNHVSLFDLEIGKGRVIKGWDEGLMLLKKGSKATFYIPSNLAYGPQDRSPIPANAILVFDVEVADVQDADHRASVEDKLLQDYFNKNNIKATKTHSGLYYNITKRGFGPLAQSGKNVSMSYTGRLMDGTAFDSNTDPKFNHVQPFSFILGHGQVIKGWDEGVQLLQAGSKGTLYIPSALAYGEKGAGGSIPANAILIFDVEVLGIN